MFNGYRFYINGVPFNDSYISKGTYSCERQKRVIGSWKDANGIDHEELAPTDKTIISFDLREHNSSEHALIIPFSKTKITSVLPIMMTEVIHIKAVGLDARTSNSVI